MRDFFVSMRVETSIHPHDFFIFSLRMYILRLKIHILRLKMHILNLKMKFLRGRDFPCGQMGLSAQTAKVSCLARQKKATAARMESPLGLPLLLQMPAAWHGSVRFADNVVETFGVFSV